MAVWQLLSCCSRKRLRSTFVMRYAVKANPLCAVVVIMYSCYVQSVDSGRSGGCKVTCSNCHYICTFPEPDLLIFTDTYCNDNAYCMKSCGLLVIRRFDVCVVSWSRTVQEHSHLLQLYYVHAGAPTPSDLHPQVDHYIIISIFLMGQSPTVKIYIWIVPCTCCN